MPKVSIITVVRNRRQTIGPCLESVRRQSFRDLEHLVVDGASTDGTLDIVRAAGGDLRVVSEPDRGLYEALNKGLTLARGEIIGLLHSDDVFFDDRVVERVVNAFAEPGLDAVFGDVEFFRENPFRVVRRYRSRFFRPSRLAWGLTPAHPSLFLRAEVFRRYGPYRTDYRIAGDIEFIARIFGGGDLSWRYLPTVFTRMRMGGLSTAGWRSTLALNREILRGMRDNGIATSLPKISAKYLLKVFDFILK